MAKNDFDIDFDFEKEYGFDPDAMGSEYTQDDFDLSELEEDFSQEETARAEDDFSDFNLDDLDLSDENAEDFDLSFEEDNTPEEELPDPEEAAFDQEETFEEDQGFDAEQDFDEELDFGDGEPDFEEEELYPDDADLTADIDFSRRANFFGGSAPQVDPSVLERPRQPEHQQPQQEPAQEEPEFEELEQEAEQTEQEKEQKPARRRERRSKPQENREASHSRPQRQPVKITMPPFLKKLVRLYFPTQEEIRQAQEPTDGSRRRRRSKRQTFKEFYLPPLILGVSFVLILSFVIGALSGAIDRQRETKRLAEEKAKQESIAAEQQATEAQLVLERAALLADSYDYKGAIEVLDSYSGEPTQEMSAKKSEYLSIQSTMVEHKDPSVIPNLSFHVLMADINRAMADKNYGGQYNRNFVSIGEFSKILEQLYMNNYILVDYDSFIGTSVDTNGTVNYSTVPIYLPQGKKPIMLTETMVNYYYYMTDSNNDGEPDSGGAGFASRLVLDANGDIKAEMVDLNGQTVVGDYDLVPILESFIQKHPDFSYRGARATLAVSGHEGVFGYRIQTEVVSKKGQAYYDQEVAGATKIVAALKEKGYKIACYTFSDSDYKQKNAAMIQQDLTLWNAQIAPVLGEVDTIVFAKSSSIGDYNGSKFDVLFNNGFRIFVKNADEPYAEVNSTYVAQSRIMVTGNALQWKTDKLNKYFDPNLVLDLTSRGGSVPN